MRRAARVDANQAEIVAALRSLGYSVQHLHTIGQGCPDVMAGLNGFNYLLEIKDGTKPPSKQRLTPDELLWHQNWSGQVAVVSSIEDAIALVESSRLIPVHPR